MRKTLSGRNSAGIFKRENKAENQKCQQWISGFSERNQEYLTTELSALKYNNEKLSDNTKIKVDMQYNNKA